MAMLKDSIITGDLRVTGTIYGKATNAVLADEATAVKDKSNGTLTYLNYSASGMPTTSWVGSWDGYTLKAISPANLKTTMALNNVENTKLSTWTGSNNITTIGTLSSGTVPWARLSGVPSTMTPSSHTHGNITNDGKIGTAANQAAYTTTNGVVTAGTLPAAAGGTGKTTLKDAANALINALDTGSSNLTANDYVITQYVGGGTTTTTYHRRPASALRVGGLLTARTFTIGSTGKTFDGTGNVSWTLAEIGAAASNHNHDSTYVNVSGDTMTGQLKTSFKSSVAMGTYQAAATTIPNLCEELRYSSGVAGSVNISTAYTKDSITIATGWYNFLWIPHRSGGVSGAACNDNCDYGSLYLSGMTLSGAYMIRYASKAIAELKNLYKPIIADHSYTPAGSVTVSTNATTNKTATVSAASSGAVTYTPAGTIAVNAAGSTVSADDITAWTTNTPTAVTKKTVVTGTSSTTISVSSEVLTIPASVITSATTGDSVSVTAGTAASLSYTARTVKSGDASYKFTGTGVRLVTGNIAVPNTYTATFSGTAATLSHTVS